MEHVNDAVIAHRVAELYLFSSYQFYRLYQAVFFLSRRICLHFLPRLRDS